MLKLPLVSTLKGRPGAGGGGEIGLSDVNMHESYRRTCYILDCVLIHI